MCLVSDVLLKVNTSKIVAFALVAIAVVVAQEAAASSASANDEVVRVINIPSGAPPTNDGYAYSQLSYNKDFLWIAGQNGYDSCGNLVPLDRDAAGNYHIYTRAYIAFLNIKAIMECFNMPMTQIPSHTVALSALAAKPLTPTQLNDLLLQWRSEVNTIQRLPEFWGPTENLPARAIIGAEWLSRGDSVEVEPKPVPRTNNRRTCLQTGIAPPSAQILLNWTVNGVKPTNAIPLQSLGIGPCPTSAPPATTRAPTTTKRPSA
jgi:enamine deaminase RidA (YjgF/YER057c/UK114 family)